jgi:ATP-binding cassette subfamily B protein
MSPARRLLGYILRYRLRYAAGVLCLVLATGFSLAIPWTIKAAVETLERGVGASGLTHHVLLILFLAAAHGVARLGSRFSMIGAGQWVEHDVRRDLYARLQRLPPSFYHRHRTGDLMSRGSNDISAVRMMSGFGAAMLVSTTLAFVGTIGAMWIVDPWLTLYATAPFPLLILVAKRFNHAVDVHSTAVQEQLGALSAKVQENLTGMPVVRAYTMEPREIEAFGRLNREYLARSLRLAWVQAGFTPLLGMVAGLGTLVILWLGGRAVVEGRISLGAFVAFNGYLAHLAWPTIALGWTLASIRRGLASMQRIAEILDVRSPADADPARPEAEGGPIPGGAIEFRHLTFAYEGRAPALTDVTFRVPEGAVVAVVGPTGSGKSTLGVLLSRLFEPPRDSIFVGGVDVRDLPLGAWRRALGYVPQEAFLFSRSLRENVLLGAPAAGQAGLSAAARTADVSHEIKAFPHGWDTVVGERGLTLSGGQRQRVALARALLGEPRILILDDPFASVDTGTESAILESLRGLRPGRTILLMTHRLRAAEEADWVVVLEDGRVVEEGRHEMLLAAGNLYARLWRIQLLEDELAQA